MNKIDSIINGLIVLKPFCSNDVQLTEAGNHICIWEYYLDNVVLPEEKVREMKELGWSYSEVMGWTVPLSG